MQTDIRDGGRRAVAAGRATHAALALALALCGCGTGARSGGGGRDGGAIGDGGTASGGDGGERGCVGVTASAQVVRNKADILFVIDNSPSMGDEIHAVETNLNNNFAAIVAAGALDYRVIMISQYGSWLEDAICIGPPLGGQSTCLGLPPPIGSGPANTATFFHYSNDINSTNSLVELLRTYDVTDEYGLAPGGWSTWLRPDALKILVEITDDESQLDEVDFDTQLLARSPLHSGTASHRNYIFYAIVGLGANTPATQPWLPTDPVQSSVCPTAVNSGARYQRLSILTGGQRFPLCELTSYDAIFHQIADGVLQLAEVPCEFTPPEPPAGQTVDPATVIVTFTSSTGTPQRFVQVADATACAPGSFYLSADKVVLCPDACTTVKADPMAKVDLTFDCSVIVN